MQLGVSGMLLKNTSAQLMFESVRAVAAGLQTVTRGTGLVQSPGLQGIGERARGRRARNIQFAHAIKSPTGRQVIVATDEHLGFGDSIRSPRPPDYEFTLIDVRFGRDGVGVGKLAPESKVVYNREKKTIELESYEKLPVGLSAVRSKPLRFDPQTVTLRGLQPQP
jgi:hypothetical protein